MLDPSTTLPQFVNCILAFFTHQVTSRFQRFAQLRIDLTRCILTLRRRCTTASQWQSVRDHLDNDEMRTIEAGMTDDSLQSLMANLSVANPNGEAAEDEDDADANCDHAGCNHHHHHHHHHHHNNDEDQQDDDEDEQVD